MRVAHIKFGCKSQTGRLRYSGGRRSGRQRAAICRASVRRGAKPLEKIIRSAIFLDNDNHMLKEVGPASASMGAMRNE